MASLLGTKPLIKAVIDLLWYSLLALFQAWLNLFFTKRISFYQGNWTGRTPVHRANSLPPTWTELFSLGHFSPCYSWFYDAPISYLGLSQIEKLAHFLKETPTTEKEAKHIAILRADPGAPPSKIVCSSLRRAVSTLALAFQERLARRPQEKILIIPSLQEIRYALVMI